MQRTLTKAVALLSAAATVATMLVACTPAGASERAGTSPAKPSVNLRDVSRQASAAAVAVKRARVGRPRLEPLV